MIDSNQTSRDVLRRIVRNIASLIDCEKQTLTNKNLMACCVEVGRINDAAVDAHLFHELTETALNLLVAEKYGAILLQADRPEDACGEILRPLQARLPAQSWRSRAQVDNQQFSTPAAIAFLLVRLMNIRGGETVLEPSAGTGSLAAWAWSAGAEACVNEIDPRRAGLLELLGFRPTTHNAEFIDDLLAPELQPDIVIMNPPFSSSGGRVEASSAKFGFRHVESALRRLKTGGRFGVILGKSGGLNTKTGNELWRKLSSQIKISSVMEIDGREYYRNGTTVNVNLIIGRKTADTQTVDWHRTRGGITNMSIRSVEEAFSKIAWLRLRLEN